MAGEWIKMRTNLWDDPKVLHLCDLTGSDEASVIGALYWLWAMADDHSSDGVLPGLTVATISRKTGVMNFGQSLLEIGWIEEINGAIRIFKFDDHNGASAKSRAQTAKRVANHRGNVDVTEPALQDQHSSDTDALAREDKRRKDKEERGKSKTPSAPRFDAQAHLESMGVDPAVARDWLILRTGKKLKPTETAFSGVLTEAQKAGMTMNEALRLCCTRGWGGFEAAWAIKQQGHGPPGAFPLNKQEALEAHNRQVAQDFARERANARS